MVNKNRRDFIKRSGAAVASGALAACGGGEAPATAAAVTNNPGPLPQPVPVPEPGPVVPVPVPVPEEPPVPGALISNARFTLSAARTQAAAPFCLGYTFRRGDVPAGSSVQSDKGSLQVTPKNSWPDGSLKFAVLAGQADVAGGVPQTLSLRLVPQPAAGAALDTARLRATGVTADIGCGVFGAVRWQGADWDAPLRTWVSGARMSSWIYRKPVGSDAHLVAWLEVRLWANGAVEVLPWIENGYLRVDGPGNRLANYSFALGGVERMAATIDLKHHQRTVLVRGSALSYWLGEDPGLIPRHDQAYLQATEVVPTYSAKMTASAAAVGRLVKTFEPLQAGNIVYDVDFMPSGGYQEPIGLLPQYDVLYLVADADVTYGAVVRNGFSAGRYGIHYRDETTQRPLRFSSYPTLNIRDSQGFKDTGASTTGSYTPATSGGNPLTWDVAHCPSVGFLAYLVTGRWYFMEEVQFATTTNYLGNGDNQYLRSGSKGLVQTAPGAWQTRNCAWDWRARTQALCVTPDDDTALRNEFIASVEANIEHFHGRYVARPHNPFGWIKPGESYDGKLRLGSPWQQDFVTAAFGYSLSLGLPISPAAAAKLQAFFLWKARSVVGRMGTRDSFWYINAAPYTMVISPAAAPDYDGGTGPWYDSEKAIYDATYAESPPAWLGNVEGVLCGDSMPAERAMWGNLQPAIAYAVRHGVPGALAAYDRMTGASNWKSVREAFDASPVWGVVPALLTQIRAAAPSTPAWLTGAAVGAWIEIPGTSGAGGAAIDAFSGMALNEATNELLIAAAGGHGDSADNRVVSLDLNDPSPSWTVRSAPSTRAAMDTPYYPDGKPTSRHLYSTLHYIPQVNRLMTFGTRDAYGNSYSWGKVDGFNLVTNTWDPAGTWPDTPGNHVGAVSVRGTGEVYTVQLARWSPQTKAWNQPVTQRTDDLIRTPMAHDSLRSQLFTLNWADGEGYSRQSLSATKVPLAGGAQVTLGFKPSAALDSFIADKPTYSGMDYDAPNDRFLFYCGQGAGAGRIYVIKPNEGLTWDISLLELAGAARPPATPGNGVHNRFRYVPKLRGFLLMPSSRSNLYFIRTS